MSKNLRKIVCSIVLILAKKKDLCEEFQSGFRPHHSTETALVKITNDLLLASDQGCITLLVLLDLSAAFDTIDQGSSNLILEGRCLAELAPTCLNTPAWKFQVYLV